MNKSPYEFNDVDVNQAVGSLVKYYEKQLSARQNTIDKLQSFANKVAAKCVSYVILSFVVGFLVGNIL